MYARCAVHHKQVNTKGDLLQVPALCLALCDLEEAKRAVVLTTG